MAETSRFFASSTGDVRTYTAPNFAEFTNRLLNTGYFAGVANELAVTASTPADMNVNVATGEAFIQGYYYKNGSSKVLAVTAADVTNPRIDRVVAELDLVTTRLITIKMLDGTAAASPVAPTLTQTATTYQITLAQVYVAAGAVTITTGNITSEKDTVTAAVSGANQAKANVLYSGTIYHLTGTDTGFTTARTAAGGCTAPICSDGTYVYIIGGIDASNCLQSVERFTQGTTTAAGAWAAMTNITTARASANPVYYNGNIYMIGGIEDFNPAVVYSVKNEIYSISGNSWSAGTDLTTARYYAAATLVGDDIYVMGGTTTGAAGSTKNEKYDVSGNSWSTLSVLPVTPTAGSFCASCTDGTNIYLSVTDGTVRFYRYNVSGDSWTALTAPSALVTFMAYYDGYIYAMSDTSTALRRYDVTLGTWNNSVVADVGFTNQMSQGNTATVFHNYRFFFAKAAATNSVWFTTHYPLTTMTARAIAGFRKNNDQTYFKLKNVTTDLIGNSGGTIGLATGDKLALAIESKSATATAIVDVYG